MKMRWKLAQWFELRWWKNYLHGKTKDEYLNWKRNYWQHLLEFISNGVKVDSAKSIADLGCGPAGIFVLHERGLAVGVQNFEPLQQAFTAVDPLIDEYEKQTDFFKKSDYPNTTFIKSTIEEFNPTQKFDLV